MNPLDVQRATVWKRGVPAATLSRDDAGTAFEYLSEYTGPDVATTLPRRKIVRLQPGQLPPFFSGLLPEGRRLTALRSAVKTSSDDEFSLLLAVGTNLVGDVVVAPEGATPLAAEPLLHSADDTFAKLRERSGLVDRVGIAGVQDKVSGAMISLPVRLAGEEAIVKLDPPEYPHVTLNEHWFLGQTKKLRQEVVASEIIRDADGVPGLVIQRFDRTPDGPLAVEDACQLSGAYPADKYRLSAAEVITVVANNCTAPAVARRAVFQQFVFAWLTGNGDLHAKNVSILQTPSGEWRPSPIYDIPSSLPYGDHTSALEVAGRRENLTRKAFLTLADEVSLPPRAAESTIDATLRATAGIAELVGEGALPFNPNLNQRMARALTRRRHDLAS